MKDLGCCPSGSAGQQTQTPDKLGSVLNLPPDPHWSRSRDAARQQKRRQEEQERFGSPQEENRHASWSVLPRAAASFVIYAPMRGTFLNPSFPPRLKLEPRRPAVLVTPMLALLSCCHQAVMSK